MGATPPPAHLPERRACSCEGPKKAHRNLVGLRRTASRSPRSVLSARASSRSFITAIGVGRRDFTVWTGRQRALLGPGCPCPAPYAGWCPSLPKRIGRTEVRSPRPFRALVALAGRNLPPLCSPPRRRAGLSAMAQIERAYATYPTTLVVPLASTHATRCSQHRPPFALVRLLRCGAAARGDCRRGNSSGSRILCTPLGMRSESVMTELVSVRDCVRDCCAPARTRRNVERTTSCVRRMRTTTR